MQRKGSFSSDEESSKPLQSRRRLNNDKSPDEPISDVDHKDIKVSTSASKKRTVKGSSIQLRALTPKILADVLQDYVSSEEDNSGDDSNDEFINYSNEGEENDVLPELFSSNGQETSQVFKWPAVPLQTTTQSFLWQNSPPTIPRIPFSSKRKLQQLPTGHTPYDYFRLLLTDDFIDTIVEETNAFAECLLLTNESPNGRIKRWKRLTREEFLVFLGITFHTGTIKCSRLAAYWSARDTKNGLSYIPIFGETMTRDRYLLILQCLHFARNPSEGQLPPMDRLFKIRPIIDYFNKTMNLVFTPGRDLSIDEPLILWRGRISFRQYIQTKRYKCGMKLHVLAESCGPAVKLLLHAGSIDVDVSDTDYTEKIVQKLLEGRTGVGHSVYIDNYYSTVMLTRTLLNERTYLTGTLKTSRQNNPIDVTEAVLRKHDIAERYTHDGICVMKWKDKREILMVSSEYSSRMVDVTNRQGVVAKKPLMVKQYNERMSGINQMDELLSYYPCERTVLKWYKKLAIHVFQLLLMNSHLLYNSYTTETKKSLYDFRFDVIEKLMTIDYPNRPPKFIPTIIPTIQHYPSRSNRSTSIPGRCKRKTCRHCKKTTKYFCDSCPPDHRGEIGLCPECFRHYHEYILHHDSHR